MTYDPRSDGWALDPLLQRDTTPVGDLPLCRVLLINDANYPWVLLVPRRHDTVEIIDLEYIEQAQLMTEVSHASRTLKTITRCDKINVAALGNVVPQLHVHVIARSRGDAAHGRSRCGTSRRRSITIRRPGTSCWQRFGSNWH